MSTPHGSTLNTDDTASPIRALHSLREPQASCIIAGLSSLIPNWAIERHESCDGFLSVVLHQRASDVAIIINHDQLGIHVDLLVDDDLQASTQPYTTTSDVVQAIALLAGQLQHGRSRHSA